MKLYIITNDNKIGASKVTDKTKKGVFMPIGGYVVASSKKEAEVMLEASLLSKDKFNHVFLGEGAIIVSGIEYMMNDDVLVNQYLIGIGITSYNFHDRHVGKDEISHTYKF